VRTMITAFNSKVRSSLAPARFIIGSLILIAIIAPILQNLKINYEFLVFQLSLGILTIVFEKISLKISDKNRHNFISSINFFVVALLLSTVLLNIPLEGTRNALVFKYAMLGFLSLAELIFVTRAAHAYFSAFRQTP